MEWGKVILVEVYERILRFWLYGRSIWMNFALLNAFNRYCVTLTGMLRQKCSVMILIWIHRWLFCWFRLRYRKFWWVFLCSVISGLNKNYVDPGRPLSVRQFVCVCVCVCLSVCVSVTASHFHKSWPMLMKIWPHNLNKKFRWRFSQILKILILWRHNDFFYVFQCGTLTSSVFVQFASNRLSHVLQLIALYGIANQRFRFISSVQNNGRKNGKNR